MVALTTPLGQRDQTPPLATQGTTVIDYSTTSMIGYDDIAEDKLDEEWKHGSPRFSMPSMK